MKKLFMASLALASFALCITAFQMTSCTKANAEPIVSKKDSLTKQQILVAKSWKVDKLHHVISGQYSEYTDGGTNTTGVNYGNVKFTFNADGTGTTLNEAGTSFPMTWAFTAPDERTLQVTATGRTDTWDMVEISGNYLHASVHLILNSGSDNIETFRLIQIP